MFLRERSSDEKQRMEKYLFVRGKISGIPMGDNLTELTTNMRGGV